MYYEINLCSFCINFYKLGAGADTGRGHAPGSRSPKMGKKYDFFFSKIVIFHTIYPKHFFSAPP